MKSASLGTLLGALSLAGLGLLYLKIQDLSDRVMPLTRARAERRHASVAEADDLYRRDPPARLVYSAPVRAPGSNPRAGTATSDANPNSNERLEHRIAELEKQLKDRKSDRPFRFRGLPRFARSVGQLSKTLKLTKAQESRVQDAVDRGSQRIQDILKIPDETGVSPYERRQQARQKAREAIKAGNYQAAAAATMAGAFSAHRIKKIPGRNTTYGEEVDRIKQETRQEIDSNLNVDQKKTFKDTRIDPLLGDQGGGLAMSFFAATTHGDGEGGAPAVVIGEGVQIAESVDGDPDGSDHKDKRDEKGDGGE